MPINNNPKVSTYKLLLDKFRSSAEGEEWSKIT